MYVVIFQLNVATIATVSSLVPVSVDYSFYLLHQGFSAFTVSIVTTFFPFAWGEEFLFLGLFLALGVEL